jgi:hypothetical protein
MAKFTWFCSQAALNSEHEEELIRGLQRATKCILVDHGYQDDGAAFLSGHDGVYAKQVLRYCVKWSCIFMSCFG